ncbi:uncharacterized protein LOC144128161 isoform X2 [Amblyomma americanum]
MPLSLVPPERVSELVPLWPAIVDSTLPGQLEHTFTGCIGPCGTRVTLCGGSWIRGYQAATGQLYSELYFGRQQEQPLAGPFVEIVRGHTVYLVVALQGGSRGSLLCVCQPFDGNIVRAIQLPAPATHLALVSNEGLGSLSGGCVAVGTADRCVLLVEVCLDSDRHYSDEGRPAGLLHLDNAFCDRQPSFSSVHGTGVHGCVHVCSLDDLADTDETSMMDEDLEVTCLQWLPQLACLGIGLSSGHVHLWDVRTASSRVVVTATTDLPVVALALQEPENDPRCCCYLWVAQGCTVSTSAATFVSTPPSSFSFATLHTLSFQKKVPCQDGRHKYKGLISSRLVFEYLLVPDMVPGMEAPGRPQSSLDNGETLGSRVLSFHTAPSPSAACPVSDTPFSSPGTTRIGSEHVEDLLLLSWQLVRGARVLGTYLSVFDINQWYRAQMPHTFRGNSHQLCAYIGLFSLSEAAANCGSHTILDVRVLPSSIRRFCTLDPMIEQTHFPSSLAFSCVCLTAEGIVGASFLGLQQQLLHNMNKEGSRCLAYASDLCVRFSIAGLISSDLRPLWHANTATAQKMLLDVALDHRLVGFLKDCLHGGTHQVGDPASEPLLPFVLDWAWKKVKEVKASLDGLYAPLFDCSGQDGVTTGERMLIHQDELRILHQLLGEARGMQAASPRLLAVWHDVAGLLCGHLSVLLFLLQSGVLPDHRVGEGCLAYPYTALQTWCQQARSDRGRKLLVDVLVEAALGGAAYPGSPVRVGYPPPSIHRATDIYLIRGIEPWAPHVVAYYLLLDISAIIFHDYPAVKEKLKRFPCAFYLSSDVQSLVQGIWHLDHGNYEEGVKSLLQAQQQASAELRPLLGALWGPAVRLLLQCQPPLALRCLDHLQVASTPEQMTLQLDVLLANCRVIDALELVRRHGHLSSLEQLLGCIMALARKSKMREAHEQLELLLQVPLSAAEEEQLVNFFSELAEPNWMCQVVLHFLQCGRPHAALPLTGCLQELFREGRSQRAYLPEVRQNVSATLELMQSVMRLMPLPASQLNAAARRRNQSGAPVQYLGTVPTSVPHKGTTPRLATRVAAVRATMEAAEASKPPAMPSAPDRVAGSESCTSISTPAVSHHTPQSRLEEDAVSILCTPPVTLWEGLPRRSASAAQPSTSTPASILRRRPVDLPRVVATPVVLRRGSGEDHAATCPTPTELSENVQPTPDPSVRRLRFAMSDSNSSEASPDLDTTGHSLGDSSMLSPPEEQATGEEEASRSMPEAEMSSDRSSQFMTPTDSDSDDSGTDLQDSNPETVRSPQPTPVQPAPSAQPRNADQDTDLNKTPGPGAGKTSSPERKALLPEFLVQEAARCLHSPTAADSGAAGPAQPEATESPSQPAPAAAAPSLAESVETSDEEDLDGTPLMDSYEDTAPESNSRPQCPPNGADLSSGLVPTAPEEEKAVPSSAAAAHVGTARVGTAQVGTAQVGTAQVGTAQVSTAQVGTPRISTSLFGAPHFGTSNVGTACIGTAHDSHAQVSNAQFQMPAEAEEATPLCDNDGTELVEEAPLVEDPPSRPCSQASTVSLRLPAFAVSGEQHTAKEEDEPVMEQHAIIISASEASESEKEEEEEDAIVILSDTSSEALLELQPTRVESPEASWSRSSGTSTRETEAPLAELSNMQPSTSVEPLEVVRGPSTGLMTPAADVEHLQVERSSPNDAVCPVQEGDLSPRSDGFHPKGAPMTPPKEPHFEDKSMPVNESFGFVPIVESPLPEGGGVVLVAAEKEPPDAPGVRLPVIRITALDCSPLPADVPSSSAASSEHSAPKHTAPEDDHDESGSETAVRTPEHSDEPPWWHKVVTSSYNLRERQKTASNEEEHGLATVTPRTSRRKSGSVPPSRRSPFTPTKAGRSRESKGSPTSKLSPARKTRAASEEPVSAHSGTKSRSSQGSAGRAWAARKSTGAPSAKRATPSPRRKSETPSPRGRSNVKATLASPRSARKRLATPSPRRQSKTPSPAKSKTPSPRKAGVPRNKSAMPSPKRLPPTSPVKAPKEHATPSSSRQEVAQDIRGQSRASRIRQKTPVTHSSGKQTAQSPSPEGEPHVRSPAKDETPNPSRTRARQRSASSGVVQERLPVPSPVKDETPLQRIRSRPARTSSSDDTVREPAPTAAQQSSRLTSDEQKTPKEHASLSLKQGLRKQTARTPSPTQESPVPSPSEDKAPSPAKKTTRLRRRSSSADVQERLPEPDSSEDEVPSKKPGSKTPRRSPATSTAKELLPMSARRSSRLTPRKQQSPEGRTATPPSRSGSRRRSSSAASTHRALETIAEGDDTGSDAETSPPTRNRSHSGKPGQTTQPKRAPLARRSRRLSSSAALDTIAEAPDAEAEQEPEPTTAPRSQGSTKRKASKDTEPLAGDAKPLPPERQPSSRKRAKRSAVSDAEGYQVAQPAEPVDEGSEAKPPADVFSPPVTRRRQLQEAEGKSAGAKSSSSMSKEDTPKTKQRRRVVIVPVLSRTPEPSRRTAASSTKFQKTPRQPAVRYKLKLRQPAVPVYRTAPSPSTKTPSTKSRKRDE